ncbi:MAG: hypothetical protein IPK26_14355 [Planctomycetes bacterium]|nr:hypothetical protein [Planctomycetota bacterium]
MSTELPNKPNQQSLPPQPHAKSPTGTSPAGKSPAGTSPAGTSPAGKSPAGGTEEGHHDETTGVFGFFRRYQKPILYSAGLFALITFSITTQMTQVVDDIVAKPVEMPTMTVAGKSVSLQPEDYDFAALLSRNWQALPPVMPMVGIGEGTQHDFADMLMYLRRAAIAEGFEVSMLEVDRAIEWLRESENAASATQLAVNRGFGSLANFRSLVGEAMRIGNYVRLQAIGAGGTEAAMLRQLLDGKEKITVRVASFDVAALQEQLKTAGGVSDDDFKKWMEGKTEQEKNTLGVFDNNKVSLLLGIARLEAFDPAQWAEELKDHKPGDDALKQTYEMEKKRRFKGEKDGEFKPYEDEAVKATVAKVAQLDEVMNKLLQKIRERQNTSIQEANAALTSAATTRNAAETKLLEAKRKLTEKPDDPALAEEVRKIDAEELQPAVARQKEAEEALKQKRQDFDMGAAFAELTKDKAGFELKPLAGPLDAEGLKNLDQQDLALGEWDEANQGTFINAKGDMGWAPGKTAKGHFLFQATEVVVRPLKPWDKLKPLLETAYFKELAKKQGDEKKLAFDTALLRLAKTKMPEKVAEIEGKKQPEIDKRFAAWEQEQQRLLTSAQAELAKMAGLEGHRAYVAWTQQLTSVQAALEKKDEQKKTIEAAVAKEIDDELRKEAKAKFGEVLDQAAQEAGFTVTSLPPYPRELSQRPRFDKANDKTVVFLFRGQVEKLEAGKTTDLVEDAANQRWHCAVVDKVEPMTVADLTRREFEMERSNYEEEQIASAMATAFSLPALEKRYGVVRVQGAAAGSGEKQ